MQTNLWHSGEGGYHTYRIPALVVTTQGTLLAFCEGRRTLCVSNSGLEAVETAGFLT